MNKTATVQLKCLLCGVQAKVKVPIRSHENLFYVEVPTRLCGKCFIELEQVIDGREKEDEGSDKPTTAKNL